MTVSEISGHLDFFCTSLWNVWGTSEAELEHWVPHDLRRTAKTNFARLGIPIHTCDLICNHDSAHLGGMDDIYNQHHYENEIRDALEKWGLELRKFISGIEEVKETA